MAFCGQTAVNIKQFIPLNITGSLDLRFHRATGMHLSREPHRGASSCTPTASGALQRLLHSTQQYRATTTTSPVHGRHHLPPAALAVTLAVPLVGAALKLPQRLDPAPASAPILPAAPAPAAWHQVVVLNRWAAVRPQLRHVPPGSTMHALPQPYQHPAASLHHQVAPAACGRLHMQVCSYMQIRLCSRAEFSVPSAAHRTATRMRHVHTGVAMYSAAHQAYRDVT